MKDRIYEIGVVVTILGLAGISENITSGRGSFMASAVLFSVGFGCILFGYSGMWDHRDDDQFKGL